MPKTSRAAPPAADQIWIALPFFIFGFLHLAGSLAWLACDPTLLTGHFYRPPVIAFAHAVGLGFLMSLVAGASYQLLPVAFENRLFSRTLAKVHLAMHIVGVPLMVHGFAQWKIHTIAIGGTAVLAGLALYVLNIGATALRPLRWTPTAAGMLGALASLCAALAVAVWILASKFGAVTVRDPLAILGVHTYLVLGGFFLLLLAAVSYTLLPMFLLVPLPGPRRAFASVGYLLAGVVLLVVGLMIFPAVLPFSALAASWGLGLFLVENATAIRRSPRKLDGGLRLYAASLGVLPLVATLAGIRGLQLAGYVATYPVNLDTLLFTLAVFGTLSCAILGMGAKIVPFLVWQRVYAPLLGRAVVPKLAGLVRPRVLDVLACTVPLTAVLLALGTAIASDLLVRSGALLYCGSVAAFFFNLTRSLSHLRHSAATPLPSAGPKPALVLP